MRLCGCIRLPRHFLCTRRKIRFSAGNIRLRRTAGDDSDSSAHRDKSAWGEDAELFRPERFSDPAAIPADAYKPFGNGQRACIGMQFALQEATMVLGLVLKHFELIDHTDYELTIKEALTIKPGDFKIRVKNKDVSNHQPVQNHKAEGSGHKEETKAVPRNAASHSLRIKFRNCGRNRGRAG